MVRELVEDSYDAIVAALPQATRTMLPVALCENRRRVRRLRPHRIALRLAVFGAYIAVLWFGAPPACWYVQCESGYRRQRRQADERHGLAGRGRQPHAALAVHTEGAGRQETPHDRSAAGFVAARPACRSAMATRRCWVKVRLPSRPNHAAAWVLAERILLRPTPWRILIWRRARAISIYRDGDVSAAFA